MKLNTYLLISLVLIVQFLFSCNNSSQLGDNRIENTSTEIFIDDTSGSGVIHNLKGCQYNLMTEHKEVSFYSPRKREVKGLEEILSFSGLPINFEIYSANIENAIATIIDSKRFIIYDSRLFDALDNKTETYWTSISILAHEIGHHLAGHTLDYSRDSQVSELEADKFSGFILYKMGASIDEATMAMELVGDVQSETTHPNKSRRLASIREGWNQANKTRFESAIPPPPENLPLEGARLEYPREALMSPENLKYRSEYLFNDNERYEGVITDFTRSEYGDYEIEIYVTKVGGDWKCLNEKILIQPLVRFKKVKKGCTCN